MRPAIVVLAVLVASPLATSTEATPITMLTPSGLASIGCGPRLPGEAWLRPSDPHATLPLGPPQPVSANRPRSPSNAPAIASDKDRPVSPERRMTGGPRPRTTPDGGPPHVPHAKHAEEHTSAALQGSRTPAADAAHQWSVPATETPSGGVWVGPRGNSHATRWSPAVPGTAYGMNTAFASKGRLLGISRSGW